MATGRTLNRWTRVYVGGISYSSETISLGPLLSDYNTAEVVTYSDAVRGGLPTQPNITPGILNSVLSADSNATYYSMYQNGYTPGWSIPMSVAIGIRAEPAIGDPCFNGYFNILRYQTEHSIDSMVTASIEFGVWDESRIVNYAKAWGNVVHAIGAETAANTANTSVDNGAATAAGGYLVYHVSSAAGSGGTYTISIDDSANGSDWLALSGATTGEIAYSGGATYGVVQLGTTATVRRYLRWQLALGTATSVTFFLAFVRG